MLREVGNHHHEAEVAYLLPHYRSMPCIMSRYAIEKFAEEWLSFLGGAA